MGIQFAMQGLAPLKNRDTRIPTDYITVFGMNEGFKGEFV
jgi:hypothetical protein